MVCSPMGGMTGVSLEQGLGLTDISRGRPETSVALRRIIILLFLKLIRAPRDSTRLSECSGKDIHPTNTY